MKVTALNIPDVLMIELDVYADDRGHLMETYSEDAYREIGLSRPFVQDNFVYSGYRTLRGLHFQFPSWQGKLVTCLHGHIFDVAVDLRLNSPTYGQWAAAELKTQSRQMWIPEGFAHGFCVLSKTADVYYKMTSPRVESDERVVNWNDPTIGIPWPILTPILSKRDAEAELLAPHTLVGIESGLRTQQESNELAQDAAAEIRDGRD